ncbi:sesquipedalian-1 [Rhinophrynus dorsalis]
MRNKEMKLDERNLVHYATCKSPVDKSGFLFKKGDRNATYHKRWFVLKGNMLFYFDNEDSKEPVGVIVLEGCRVELCESTEEYAFAINFAYAKSRAYILAADSQSAMESWVKALSRANFEYIRLVVNELQKQLGEIQKGTNYYEIQGATEKNKTKCTTSSNNIDQGLSPDTHDKSMQLCSVQKDNGYGIWNNHPNNVYDDYADFMGMQDNDRVGHTRHDLQDKLSHSSLPLESPVQAVNGEDEAGASSDTRYFSVDTISFSKLHDFFGEEIMEVRAKWLESFQKSAVKQNMDCGD